MTTTTRAIYEKIQAEVREALAGEVGSDQIYLIAEPTFDPRSDVVVQIVLGAPQAQSGESAVGLVAEEFDIVIWFQSYADEGRVDTEKLINATWSVLKIISTLRKAIIQNLLDSVATVPVMFVRGSRPARDLDNYGWINVTDTYVVGYEIEWR